MRVSTCSLMQITGPVADPEADFIFLEANPDTDADTGFTICNLKEHTHLRTPDFPKGISGVLFFNVHISSILTSNALF